MKFEAKARIVIVAVIVVFLTGVSVSRSAARPPEVTPPIPYEVNAVSYPIMDYVVIAPGDNVSYALGAHTDVNEPWYEIVLDVVIDGNSIDPNMIETLAGLIKDANGGWNQYWQASWIVPTYYVGGVTHYMDLIVSDTLGRTNRRTVVIYIFDVDGLYLFPVPREEIVGSQQKNWQTAKKQSRPFPYWQWPQYHEKLFRLTSQMGVWR